MSHYRIEGGGRLKPQPVTAQRGTSQTQPEYIPRTKAEVVVKENKLKN